MAVVSVKTEFLVSKRQLTLKLKRLRNKAWLLCGIAHRPWGQSERSQAGQLRSRDSVTWISAWPMQYVNVFKILYSKSIHAYSTWFIWMGCFFYGENTTFSVPNRAETTPKWGNHSHPVNLSKPHHPLPGSGRLHQQSLRTPEIGTLTMSFNWSDKAWLKIFQNVYQLWFALYFFENTVGICGCSLLSISYLCSCSIRLPLCQRSK